MRISHWVRTLGAALLSVVMMSAASAQTLYGVTGASNTPSSLYTIDTATGAATLVGATGFSHVTGLSFDPTTGILYGHVSDIFNSGATQLITINPQTGAGTLIGTTGIQVPDMAFRSDGTLFAWSEWSNGGNQIDDLFIINKVTATATIVAESGTGTSNTGLAFSTNGTLFMKSGLSLFTVNPDTGATTTVGSISGPFNLNNALAFNSDTVGFSILRPDNQNSVLYLLDTETITATEIGNMGVAGMAALAFVAVPEPATIVLISGVALAGAAVGYRNVRKARRFGKLAK